MRTIGVVIASLILGHVAAASVYPVGPDWFSADTQFSTGAALVDIDLDGFVDLVVANGNDMASQHVVVYYNQGDGTLPTLPDWQSADTFYHGHLDVADVNGDGWPDVAVANLGKSSTVSNAAKVYMNQAGTLSATPDWVSDELANAFGVAFGDMNNDGRPDLAVATGWPYSNPDTDHNYVHLNIGGALESTASWQSDDTRDYMNALWVDADDDGWLDLLLLGANHNSYIHRNLGGVLETTASWHTTDNPAQFSIMAAVGDVTGDGRRDLIATDNAQLFGGVGDLRQYDGQSTGLFSTSPNWTYFNDSHDYGSAVALADVNDDGLLDLASGAWWSRPRIFLNGGTGFGSDSDWQSTRSTVVERIVFADVNNDGILLTRDVFSGAQAAGQLFHLAHQPVQEVYRVWRDDTELGPSEYTINRVGGWITVAAPAGDVVVEYSYSRKPDMVMTNWDSTVGNFLYLNRNIVAGDMNCDGWVNSGDIDLFVMALLDPSAYELANPDCALELADCSRDGWVNNGDIDAFLVYLVGS